MNIDLFMQNFHWLRPLWLLLVPIVIGCWFVLSRKRAQSADKDGLIAPHIVKLLTIPAEQRSIATPLNSLMLLTLCAILAASGPSWQRQASPLTEDEALLLVVLDVSHSMLQTDVQPSRLERSKQKINDLLSMRAGSRSGLIVYAGSAHSVIPLTNDLDIVWHFLDAVDNDMMPRQGKSAATITPVLNAVLSESELVASGVPASVLLITDAVDKESQQTLAAYFEQTQHQLLILGVGKDQWSGSADTDRPLDFTAMDENSLRELAKLADGDYHELSADKRDVRRINWQIKNHLLFVDDEARPWIDAGYYLLFPTVLLSMLWFRRGWNVQYGAAVLLTLSLGLIDSEKAYADEEPELPSSAEASVLQSFVDLWFTRDQQAQYFFEQGNYQRAAALYRRPMPRGVALYLSEQFVKAAEVFATVDSNVALFNRANALAHAQHYVKAVELYTELLNRVPDHQAAAKNRGIIQTLIDDINRMSESQQSEPGEASRELGDAPQRADGAEQQSGQLHAPVQFSAEQILTDQRIQQQWMKQVQQNPARFLAVKFQMQLQATQTTSGTINER